MGTLSLPACSTKQFLVKSGDNVNGRGMLLEVITHGSAKRKSAILAQGCNAVQPFSLEFVLVSFALTFRPVGRSFPRPQA